MTPESPDEVSARLRDAVMEAAENCGLTTHFHASEVYRDPPLAIVAAALERLCAYERQRGAAEALGAVCVEGVKNGGYAAFNLADKMGAEAEQRLAELAQEAR